MRGITKRFPGVLANDDVTFEAGSGRFTRSSVRTAPARRLSRTS
jgi:hypothetical protein